MYSSAMNKALEVVANGKSWERDFTETNLVTQKILDSIAKKEGLIYEEVVEQIVFRKVQGVEYFVSTIVFILMYSSYQYQNKETQAYDLALETISLVTPKVSDPFVKAFVDESLSIQSLKNELRHSDINNFADLESCFLRVIKGSYSGKH